MGETIGAPDRRTVTATTSQTALGRSVGGWARLALGVGLAATVGLSLLNPERESARWLLAFFGLCCSLVLIGSGLGAIFPRGRVDQTSADETLPAGPEGAPVRSLGDFLVHECKLITPDELARALARHGETGRPLGETVMEMGLITADDLRRVLRVHWGLRDLWRDSPAEN